MDTHSNPSEQPSASPKQENDNIRHSDNMNSWRAIQNILGIAFVMATLFTIWTPTSLFTNSLAEKMSVAFRANPVAGNPVNAITPTARPLPRIGIVVGHSGANDPGAVCKDGLTEVEVNRKIATLVRQILVKDGYEVDLLDEFDSRLFEYQALALVSIHNDSCDYINDEATGFKVAAALNNTPYQDNANKLTACLIDRYSRITGLRFHYNSITPDMTLYHAFSEINTDTAAAIIETGFLNLDRQILTEHTDVVAEGVAQGILCYVRNENVPQP